jgi:hypothetical protein
MADFQEFSLVKKEICNQAVVKVEDKTILLSEENGCNKIEKFIFILLRKFLI